MVFMTHIHEQMEQLTLCLPSKVSNFRNGTENDMVTFPYIQL